MPDLPGTVLPKFCICHVKNNAYFLFRFYPSCKMYLLLKFLLWQLKIYYIFRCIHIWIRQVKCVGPWISKEHLIPNQNEKWLFLISLEKIVKLNWGISWCNLQTPLLVKGSSIWIGGFFSCALRIDYLLKLRIGVLSYLPHI